VFFHEDSRCFVAASCPIVTKFLSLWKLYSTSFVGISKSLPLLPLPLLWHFGYWTKQWCHTFSVMRYCFFSKQDYLSNWLQSKQSLMQLTWRFASFATDRAILGAVVSSHMLRLNDSLLNCIPIGVERDPVSTPRSNRILQFRTASVSDWISKKLSHIRSGYPNCVDQCNHMFNQRVSSDIDWIGYNIWTVLSD